MLKIFLVLLLTSWLISGNDVTYGVEIEIGGLYAHGEYGPKRLIRDKKIYKLHTDATEDGVSFQTEYSTNDGLGIEALAKAVDLIKEDITKIWGSLSSYYGINGCTAIIDQALNDVTGFSNIFKTKLEEKFFESSCSDVNADITKIKELYEVITTTFKDPEIINKADQIIKYQTEDQCELSIEPLNGTGDAIVEKMLTKEWMSLLDSNISPNADDILKIKIRLKDLMQTLIYYNDNFKHILKFENQLAEAKKKRYPSMSLPYDQTPSYRMLSENIAWGFIDINPISQRDGKNLQAMIIFSGIDYLDGNKKVDKAFSELHVNDLSIALQLSVQLKINKIPELMRYYLDYKKNIPQCNEKDNPSPIPKYCTIIEDLFFSSTLFNIVAPVGLVFKDTLKYVSDSYNAFLKVFSPNWKPINPPQKTVETLLNDKIKKIIIKNALKLEDIEQVTADNLADNQFDLSHVIGFVYLLITHITTIFNGNLYAANMAKAELIIKSEAQINWHGPKTGLTFMSRNTFYELYQAMNPVNKDAFIEFCTLLCTPKILGKSICDRSILTAFKYGKDYYYSSNVVKEIHIDNKLIKNLGINLNEWLKSITSVRDPVTDKEHYICRLKTAEITAITDIFEDYFDCKPTDLLSPPPPMRDINGQKALEDYFNKLVIAMPDVDKRIEALQAHLSKTYAMGAFPVTQDKNDYALLEIRATANPAYLKFKDLREFVDANTIKLDEKIKSVGRRRELEEVDSRELVDVKTIKINRDLKLNV